MKGNAAVAVKTIALPMFLTNPLISKLKGFPCQWSIESMLAVWSVPGCSRDVAVSCAAARLFLLRTRGLKVDPLPVPSG